MITHYKLFYKLFIILFGTIFFLSSSVLKLKAQGYCTTDISYYGCAWTAGIDNFHLSNINHVASGCGSSTGITDYTADTCLLAQGEPYMLIYSTNSGFYGSAYDQLGVWIDFNNDSDFADVGEYLSPYNMVGMHNFIVSISPSAPLGIHRMRLRCINDFMPGSMDSSKSCYVFYTGETEDYTVNIGPPPLCSSVNNVSISNIQLHSAEINWSCTGCTESFIVEYGATGFVPGTGSGAGVGGTIINVAAMGNLPVTIPGLNSSTYYDVYVRKNCSANGFSSNYGPINFLTKYDVCGTLTTINCGDTILANIPSGPGAFDSTACGLSTGKELLYSFTPTATGIYTLTILNASNLVNYCIKEASSGCNSSDWNCAQLVPWSYQFGSPGTIILDTLQAGVNYLICVDASNKDYGANHSFKIDCYDPYNSCANITSINCGVPQQVNIDPGLGLLNNYNVNDLPVFGKEKLFSFVPATTGVYSISVFSFYDPTGYSNTVRFKFKAASDGCNVNNWQDIWSIGTGSSTFHFILGSLIAGKEYLINLDPVQMAGCSINFQVDCYNPVNACNNIQNITCDSTIHVTIDGGVGMMANQFGTNNIYSYMSPISNCAGKETMFRFTSTITGRASLHTFYNAQPNWDNYLHYFIKDEAAGCNSNGWSHIGTGYYDTYLEIPILFEAGHSYLIMVDGLDVSGNSQDFEITCPVYSDMCANIQNMACGDTVVLSIPAGVGNVSVENQNYYASGQERIISFTATNTGTYALNIISSDNKGVKYVIKDASEGGCDTSNWHYLNIGWYPTTIYTPMLLTAGHNYYIMFDATSMQGANQTISLMCAGNEEPCANIIPIGCDTDVSFSNPHGLGRFNPLNSDWYVFPGRETIFEFTPSITGTYLLNISNSLSYYSVGYFIKKASDGCNNNNWSMIASTGWPGTIPIPVTLKADTTYYIMADSYTEGQTFNLICPSSYYDYCSTSSTISGCNNQITTTIPSGIGSYMGRIGKEKLFEFTPTLSGFYSLKVDSGTTGSLSYLIKPASQGCNETGWQSITEVYTDSWYFYPVVARTPFPLVAGTTYYILIDANDTSGITQYFKMICPVLNDPCISVTNISSCGISITDSLVAGTNQWNLPPVTVNYFTFIPTGNLKIYSFTPSQGGMRRFDFSAAMGNAYVYIKPASLGCDGNNWVPSNTNDPYYKYFPFELQKDTAYLILVAAYEPYRTGQYYLWISCPLSPQYVDNDLDGYGDINKPQYFYYPIYGCTNEIGDCNDNNIAVHPFATELCDGLDNDCNGLVDEFSFTVSSVVTNVKCKGSATGSITLSLSGAGPFTFGWTNGSTQQNLSNLTAGTYTAFISNANGCTQSITCVVNNPPTFLTASLSKINIRCHGHANGKITVQASGGWGNYSYYWSNGSTTATINNLPAGTYTCTIMDGGGCVKVLSTTITQNGPLNAIISPVTSSSAIVNVSGGKAPYSYMWKTTPTQFTQTATGLMPGITYKVKVSDSKNCTALLQFTMPAPKTDLNASEINMLVFPNPSQGAFTVNFSESVQSDITLRIFDMTGRVVLNRTYSNPGYTIDIKTENIKAGMYLLEIENSAGKLYSRLIIE